MGLPKIKMQEKRNEVNNTSSSGFAGAATVTTTIKHAPSAQQAGSRVSAVSLEAGSS